MFVTLALPLLYVAFAQPPAEKLERQKQETARMKERIAAMLPDLEGAAAGVEDPASGAGSLITLSNAYSFVGDHKRAGSTLDAALALRKRVPDPKEQDRVDLEIALALEYQGEPKQAATLAETIASRWKREDPEESFIHFTLSKQALPILVRQKPGLAKEYIAHALGVVDQTKIEFAALNEFVDLAYWSRKLGDADGADKVFDILRKRIEGSKEDVGAFVFGGAIEQILEKGFVEEAMRMIDMPPMERMKVQVIAKLIDASWTIPSEKRTAIVDRLVALAKKRPERKADDTLPALPPGFDMSLIPIMGIDDVAQSLARSGREGAALELIGDVKKAFFIHQGVVSAYGEIALRSSARKNASRPRSFWPTCSKNSRNRRRIQVFLHSPTGRPVLER